ncbi:Probable ubiquitin-conjugating enzyme E2 R521 (E2 ubiquitin-conjugating enzyme R521) (Ubiquitin carrier protein) (Ubiquitin-protein ligase) [Durusdinium trenchii]|uniref:Probable ubiquitin-conjugating enzyme E2 R521 (E2 ubiquitin-conjugating enzyme R521) (Ubiquitin carrier protein) (Ubiquitin-protein ligase) n=1 Tax=Durusdinium trenchii TaxID=1381693 RepID=A0ABP0RE29_9DINO
MLATSKVTTASWPPSSRRPPLHRHAPRAEFAGLASMLPLNASSAEPRSVIGCMAECEARDFCGSFDRGTVPQSECCLFYKGNTGDGEAQRECFVKKTLPNELLPANHLSGTSVGVVPVPFIRYLKLTSNNEGLNADSQQGYCPFWTWCGFVVKDCFGGLLYDVVLQRTTDMDASGQEMLGTSVLAYVVKNAAGDILGRTAKLTDGSEPILIFNKDNQPVAVMVTPAGILMRALFDMTWYVNVLNPDIPVQQEPMTDPRLLTFIVTYQFRGLGFFGTFVTLLIFFLVLSVVCYLLYLRFYASAWLGPSSLRLWLSEWCGCCFPKRSQLLIDHEGYACCGRDTVCFNPNLYSNGKVCLSLLGTWQGETAEQWDSQTSRAVQVLISIQSLILVSQPYFNEPGFEREIGTEPGERRSREYNRSVKENCIRWAMIDVLKNPKKDGRGDGDGASFQASGGGD